MDKNLIAVSAIALLLLSTGCGSFDALAYLQGESSEQEKAEEPPVYKVKPEKKKHHKWHGKHGPHLRRGGPIVEADFLYWRADEEGLGYAFGHSVHEPKIHWDPGFKLGFGYTFGCHDYWDLMLRWTYFHTNQTGNAHGLPTPVWFPTSTGQTATHSSGHWTLLYNTYDLELGRDYFICRTIALRPHVGLRGATIDQDYHARYRAFQIASNVDLQSTSFKADNDFWGIGIRAGAGLQWNFAHRWSILGAFSGALLYGHFDVDERASGFASSKLSREFSRVAPNLEASLGLQWEMFYSHGYRIAIGVMYEFSEWFSQNQMARVIETEHNGHLGVPNLIENSGNLGLQGGTLRVLFDF